MAPCSTHRVLQNTDRRMEYNRRNSTELQKPQKDCRQETHLFTVNVAVNLMTASFVADVGFGIVLLSFSHYEVVVEWSRLLSARQPPRWSRRTMRGQKGSYLFFAGFEHGIAWGIHC